MPGKKRLYTSRYSYLQVCFNGKAILITAHAIKRARERNIAFPDQVYAALCTGKAHRFGKNFVKFIGKSGVVCVGEDVGECIIIKTIERGN